MSTRTIAMAEGPVLAVPETETPHGPNGRRREQGTLRQNLEGRLSRIEGQIRGIRSMTAERRECVDVITQIAAVRAALKKVADLMVTDHVDRWLRQASPSGSHDQDVEDLLKVFKQYYR